LPTHSLMTLNEQTVPCCKHVCITCGYICVYKRSEALIPLHALLSLLTLTDCLDRHQLAIYLAKRNCNASKRNNAVYQQYLLASTYLLTLAVSSALIIGAAIPDCSHSLFIFLRQCLLVHMSFFNSFQGKMMYIFTQHS
jgi:hypothetical protein